jgi:hypothetical protein
VKTDSDWKNPTRFDMATRLNIDPTRRHCGRLPRRHCGRLPRRDSVPEQILLSCRVLSSVQYVGTRTSPVVSSSIYKSM